MIVWDRNGFYHFGVSEATANLACTAEVFAVMRSQYNNVSSYVWIMFYNFVENEKPLQWKNTIYRQTCDKTGLDLSLLSKAAGTLPVPAEVLINRSLYRVSSYNYIIIETFDHSLNILHSLQYSTTISKKKIEIIQLKAKTSKTNCRFEEHRKLQNRKFFFYQKLILSGLILSIWFLTSFMR